MVLLAAYQVLLARHTGQTTSWSARPSPAGTGSELEPLVGYLARPLVLRGDLSRPTPFTELLGRTRDACWTR